MPTRPVPRDWRADVVNEVMSGPDGAALARGFHATLVALDDRRVAVLAVADDFGLPGCRCPECHWVGSDHTERCPYCRGPLAHVPDIVPTLISHAVAQGADVVVCSEGELDGAGKIGALLRS